MKTSFEYLMEVEYAIDLKKCVKEIEELIKCYGDRAVFRLDEVYDKYGIDITNHARSILRGKVLGI